MDQKGNYPRDNHQPPPAQNFDYQQPPPAYSDLPPPPQIGFQNPHQQQFQQATFHPNQFPREPIVQQPTIVQTVYVHQRVGPEPCSVICPSCSKQTVTRMEYETSTKTHLVALLICLLCWPCAWIPYTMDACKGVNHYCPHCNNFVGSYTA